MLVPLHGLGARAAVASLGVVVALGTAIGCGSGGGGIRPKGGFGVKRITPGDASTGSRLLLNQPIAIYFDASVSSYSLDDDTIRVIGPDGRPVDGELERGTGSVRWIPKPPMTPNLEDGSLQPDTVYRLEIAGWPAGHAVRSADGDWLRKSVVRELRTVPADGPLFLPEPRSESFRTIGDRKLVAIGSRTLTVFFDRPLDPRTVGPEAFRLVRVMPGRMEPSAVASVRLSYLLGAGERGPLYRVDVTTDAPICETANDTVFAVLRGKDQPPLRDYGGNPVEELGPIHVHGYTGKGTPLHVMDFAADTSGGDGAVLTRAEDAALSFECERTDGAVAQVRAECGDGELGLFRPREDTDLRIGQFFDRGDGVRVRTHTPRFDFTAIDIPHGVTVTVHAARPVVLAAMGFVRVRGQLVFAGTPPGRSGVGRVGRATVASLLDAAGAAVLAGGDLEIAADGGEVAWQPPISAPDRPAGTSLSLIVGGRMIAGGVVPPRSVIALDPASGQSVKGEIQGFPEVVQLSMDRRAPDGIDMRVEATTAWFRLPRRWGGRVDVRAVDPVGDIAIAVQTADPDSVNPARPTADSIFYSRPTELPLPAPLEVRPGVFVRYILRGRVRAGQPRPSVRRLVVETR